MDSGDTYLYSKQMLQDVIDYITEYDDDERLFWSIYIHKDEDDEDNS